MNPIILSIQSEVVYGHVGHQASRFILERLGCLVWSVPTVIYSNHLGKKTWRGRQQTAKEIAELIDGLDELGVLSLVSCVFSGYLGAAQAVPVVIDAIGRVKKANPRALYACDPVLGDDGRLYVSPDLAPVLAADLVPLADLLLPNVFELRHLSGNPVLTRADARVALGVLARKVPTGIILATGVVDADHPGEISTLALTQGRIEAATARRFPLRASGTGDAFAALFLGDYLRHRDVGAALARAMRAMEIITAATVAAEADELKIVETQDEWVEAMKA
jgi:pyridoxine kinase